MEYADLKEYDVYHAQWKERELCDQKDHCFEGLFVVRFGRTPDKLMFYDTFWNLNGLEGKCYDFDTAIEHFNLSYYTNLKDIEAINKYETDEYEDTDIFVLHTQHSCYESCRQYYKKIGAKKSVSKKIASLNEKLEQEKSNINSSINAIKWLTSEITQLEINGFKLY